MAIATSRRKRYTVAGDFSLKDRHGLIHHLVSGDQLPAHLQELLEQREIDLQVACGMFREVGWTPPPRQAEPARTPPTPEEILDGLALPAAGPRGVEIRELDKSPTVKDLAVCATPGPITGVIVHRLPDGTSIASLDFGRLMRLYATRHGAGR